MPCAINTISDTTPDAFSFTDVTGQALNTLITSNTITINGINSATPVSVSGAGSPQISIAGGAWATSGSITNGQTLQVRLTSANAFSTARTATVDVGGVTDVWSVTTTGACSLPWGGTLADGSSVTAWNSLSSCGACASQTRTCTAGTLSGSHAHASCNNSACASCTLPWGGSTPHGTSVTAYSTNSVACGSSCPAGSTRTCTNGTLSGSGTFASCSVAACAGCGARSETWTQGANSCNGSTPALSHGGSTAVTDSTGTTGSVTMNCTNGSLSQSGANCAAACIPDGTLVPGCTLDSQCCSGNCDDSGYGCRPVGWTPPSADGGDGG